MKFNFRKISAVLASGIMAVSSIGFAAAANYPAPFVSGGAADVAIVYGTGAGVSSLDIIQSGNIQTNLQAKMGSGSGGTDSSITGEAAELFSGGTKIYVNDSLNTVKKILTKSNLPTVLKDESFSGIVDATITQTIELGSNPRITFAKQPTSSDDPQYALTTTTTTANYIYNASATFSKAIDFNNASSEGQEITLFGQKYTVASATSGTSLVLLQSAEKISLSSDDPTIDVVIGGNTYTVELLSCSDTDATIKVTDSSGASNSATVSEAASKKIQGLTIAVTTADETNFKLSTTLVAGSEKITMTSGSTVTYGEDDTSIDGATATFVGGVTAMTKLVVSVVAGDSDQDAIKAGEAFVDPVFKSFKLDFSGFNIAVDSTSREEISFASSGDNKEEVTFTDHTGNEKTIMFAKNTTSQYQLFADDDNRNFSVMEGEILHREDLVVVGNEDQGHLLRLTSVKNESSGTNNDNVWFTDVFTGDVLKTTWTADGTGTLTVAGNPYTVTLRGNNALSNTAFNVTLNYPDSNGAGVAIIYPTIQTSKGAKLFFYEPTTINLNKWDALLNDSENLGSVLTELKFPDGDGYTSANIATKAGNATQNSFTISGAGSGVINTGNANFTNLTLTIGQLTYNLTGSTTINESTIQLLDRSNVGIAGPAVVIFEEKNDNSVYEALIVKLDNGVTSEDGIGIEDVERTWSNDNTGWETTVSGNSKIQKDGDLWGSIITTDTGDSDQATAKISYPEEQIYAQIYVAEDTASIIAGTSGTAGTSTPLGEVLVKDSEVSSVATKNLIIIGGSCINSAAASVLGAGCGEAFTANTGVGSGQFLIKGVSDSSITSKLALVVAGYNAEDTVNAAKYLTTQTVDTSKEYKGTSSTTAELVTTETA